MIVLAVAVAAAFVIAVAGVIAIEVAEPGQNTVPVSSALGGVFTALLGITVGFAAGRRGRNGNAE
jgi:NADH:ubiquinone oxidoreductase subunit 6 (subunit J)